jgi:hypothetical protein
MIQYTIQFELIPDKLNEFNLSWNSFHEHMKDVDGLSTCKIAELSESCREIEMLWKEQYYLNIFMKGEWFTFLQGAITLLGNKSIITQKYVDPD